VLDVPENTRFIGWMNDTLLYRTRDLIRTVAGGYSTAAGLEAFGFEPVFEAEEYSLTLWGYNPDGDDSVVFETEGYDLGITRRIANERLLLTLIPSNANAVTVLNMGVAGEDVHDMVARPVTRILENSDIIMSIDGGQADYLSGEFAVVPLESS
jgi:hypothetical protein